MAMDRLKRELREQKREVKKKGNRHRRQQLKRTLRETPDDAHLARPTVGRHRSADLNGLDRDATRQRSESGTESAMDSGGRSAEGTEVEEG